MSWREQGRMEKKDQYKCKASLLTFSSQHLEYSRWPSSMICLETSCGASCTLKRGWETHLLFIFCSLSAFPSAATTVSIVLGGLFAWSLWSLLVSVMHFNTWVGNVFTLHFLFIISLPFSRHHQHCPERPPCMTLLGATSGSSCTLICEWEAGFLLTFALSANISAATASYIVLMMTSVHGDYWRLETALCTLRGWLGWRLTPSHTFHCLFRHQYLLEFMIAAEAADEDVVRWCHFL